MNSSVANIHTRISFFLHIMCLLRKLAMFYAGLVYVDILDLQKKEERQYKFCDCEKRAIYIQFT